MYNKTTLLRSIYLSTDHCKIKSPSRSLLLYLQQLQPLEKLISSQKICRAYLVITNSSTDYQNNSLDPNL